MIKEECRESSKKTEERKRTKEKNKRRNVRLVTSASTSGSASVFSAVTALTALRSRAEPWALSGHEGRRERHAGVGGRGGQRAVLHDLRGTSRPSESAPISPNAHLPHVHVLLWFKLSLTLSSP